jgi:chitinase
VDVCPTGLTTVTATYTRTCYEGDDESDYTGVPPGWTVTVTEYVPHYGAKPTPVTVTKPAEVPAKPTYVPKPDGDAKPVSTLVVVVTPVPAAEYGAYVAKQSAAAAAAAASQGGYAKPAYGSDAEASAVAKPVSGYSPSKPADGSWPQGTYAPSGTKGVYAPQFTGAASRMNVGFGLFAGAAVAAIAAF